MLPPRELTAKGILGWRGLALCCVTHLFVQVQTLAINRSYRLDLHFELLSGAFAVVMASSNDFADFTSAAGGMLGAIGWQSYRARSEQPKGLKGLNQATPQKNTRLIGLHPALQCDDPYSPQ